MPRSGLAAHLRLAGSIVLALTAGACAAPGSVAGSDTGQVFDVRAGRFIAPAELAARIAPVRFRLLGEMHDNPAHHELRAGLIDALARRGQRPAVVFEQFDLDHDVALREAQRPDSDADALASAGALDRKAWQWPLHKPVLEAALRAGFPVRAGNVSRTALNPVIRTGELASLPGEWSARLNGAAWSHRSAEILAQEIRESHCNKLPATVVPRLALAQRVRDAAMATALVLDATVDGAVLIAGNGHVRRDLGVPTYLDVPAGDVVAVGWIEVDADDRQAADFPLGVALAHPGFDYLWFTSPVTRDDPCAQMRAAGAP